MTESDLNPEQKWWALLAVALGLFAYAVNHSVVQTALPTLAQELRTDFAAIQWVLLSFQISLTTVMLSIGRLADLVGKKRIFTIGLMLFAIASFLCGLSTTVYLLIGSRILQAVGAATIVVLAVAIVTEIWPKAEQGRAIGISSASISLGSVLGPTLGGYLIAAYGWRAGFFVNVPFGLLAILLVLRYVPNLPPKRATESFDYLGATLLGSTLLAFSLALTMGQKLGFGDPLIAVLFVISIITLVVFFLVEHHVRHPMLDFSLFHNRRFSLHLLLGGLAAVATSGVVFLLPFYMQLVIGLPIVQVGTVMAIISLELALVAPVAGSLADRFGAHLISLIGLAFLSGGFLVASTTGERINQVEFLLRMLPMGFGMALFISPNTSAVMGIVPRQRLGVGSGMASIMRTLGQTAGIALLGTLFAANVDRYAGEHIDVTTAPVTAITHAFQSQFGLVAVVVSVSLLAALYVDWCERQRNKLSTLPTGAVAQKPIPK